MEEHIFVNFNAPPAMIRLTTYIDLLEPPWQIRRNARRLFAGLPPMIGRMAFFNRDEGAAAGRADFAVGGQLCFDRRSIFL